jgi:hypothetical protein
LVGGEVFGGGADEEVAEEGEDRGFFGAGAAFKFNADHGEKALKVFFALDGIVGEAVECMLDYLAGVVVCGREIDEGGEFFGFEDLFCSRGTGGVDEEDLEDSCDCEARAGMYQLLRCSVNREQETNHDGITSMSFGARFTRNSFSFAFGRVNAKTFRMFMASSTISLA